MNKRIEKLINRIENKKEGQVIRPRRDQVKKAIEENGFDYLIYKGYDEVYSVEPKKLEPTLSSLESYWLEDGKMWSVIENNQLIITIQYGYSYMKLIKELTPVIEESVKEKSIEVTEKMELIKKAEEYRKQVLQEDEPNTNILSGKLKVSIINGKPSKTFKIKQIETQQGLRYYVYSLLQFRYFPIKVSEFNELVRLNACYVVDKSENFIISHVKEDYQNAEQTQEVQEPANIINFADFKNKKCKISNKSEEKKEVKMCVCGHILKGHLESNIGICYNCMDMVIDKFKNGELPEDSLLYKHFDAIFNK